MAVILLVLERRTEFDQPLLQLWTAQSRHPNVEEDAARDIFGRQAIQQELARSVGRHLVTGVLQTTLHRSRERRIVVYNMHKP